MSSPKSGPVHRGLWFEDYALDQVYVSAARTITEGDVAAFAAISGDFNPLHVDAVFARRTPYRQRIAHGMYLNAVASGLAAQMGIFDGTIVAFAELHARFVKPAFFGDTVHVRLRVIGVDENPSRRRGKVHFGTEMLNQDGDTIAEGDWMMLFLRRRPGSQEDES